MSIEGDISQNPHSRGVQCVIKTATPVGRASCPTRSPNGATCVTDKQPVGKDNLARLSLQRSHMSIEGDISQNPHSRGVQCVIKTATPVGRASCPTRSPNGATCVTDKQPVGKDNLARLSLQRSHMSIEGDMSQNPHSRGVLCVIEPTTPVGWVERQRNPTPQ